MMEYSAIKNIRLTGPLAEGSGTSVMTSQLQRVDAPKVCDDVPSAVVMSADKVDGLGAAEVEKNSLKVPSDSAESLFFMETHKVALTEQGVRNEQYRKSHWSCGLPHLAILALNNCI